MKIKQAFRCPHCGIIAYVLELSSQPGREETIENVGAAIRLHHELYHKIPVLTCEHFAKGYTP